MSEQILDVLIKVAKLGDGDEKLIAGLQKLKTEAATGAAPALEKTGAEGAKAAKSLGGLEIVSGRLGGRILSMAGISREAQVALKGLELGARGAAGGLTLASAATAGLGAVVLGAIAGATKLASDLDAASTAEVDSAKAAVAAEASRAKMLEAVGLSARSTTKDILDFVAGQKDAIESFERFAKAGEKEQKFFEQENRLRGAERGGRSQIAALEFERQGIGLEGPAKAAFEVASKKAAMARDEAERQEKLSDLSEKKAALETSLGALEEAHSNRKEASNPKMYAAEAEIIEQRREQLEVMSKQVQLEGTELLQLQKVNAEKSKNLDLMAESEKQKAAETEQQDILGMEFAAAEKAEREAKEANRKNADAALNEAAAAQKAKIDAMTFGAAGAAPSSFIGIRGPEAGRAGFRMLGADRPGGAGFVGLGGAPAGLDGIGVKKEDVAGAAKQTGKSVGDELKSALAGFPDEVVAGLAPEIEKLTQQLSSEMSQKFAEWIKTQRN